MKKLSLFLILMVAARIAQAQTIEQTYHFIQPVVSERDGYQQIGFQGCLPNGTVGEPTLPWQSVSLILPQGQEAVAISVEFSDFVELEGTFNLYPAQQPRPVSSERAIPFAKNESLYRSENAYPTRSYGQVSTQYLNGVAFAFSGFTPVQYVPATGKVSYAKTVKVSIETQASRDDHSHKLWLTPENAASVQRLAQNPSLLGSYNKRGREIGGYDMLVITAEEWIPRFGEYLNLYNDKGIRTHIVALEEIYATMDGRDEQEQIRNYIIREYENNGIQMVSLGGDVSIVPYRSLYCFAQEGDEDNLPSDMYYACLDGTLNDDGDDRWGEVGEDDLLPELGIGRLPFNNEAQFETIMHKTFSYLLNPVLGEFSSPILGAEHLGDGYYGSDDMERLIGENNDFDYTTYGYPENYSFKRYYATPSQSWSGSAFRNVIGTGGQYVHHVGHANTEVVAGWDLTTVNDNYFSQNDGINHNYMLFHSHGCICGNFPSNCILEKMITVNTGFVVTTGNSRYGWYVPWGDGMAAHIHREFVDAYCNDHIASVGMALREAKIATAPWVTIPFEEKEAENGYLRWNLYCLNVLGDAALCPWFEEPFTPNVVYEQGLMVGTTSTSVHVSRFDTPLDNFRVSLFDGETLLGFGVTDENGNVELSFEPLQTVGALRLVVMGQSAWPQVLDVTGINGNDPFIYGDIINFEGEALSGTQGLGMDGNLYNKSNATAYNVHATVTCDCEYINVYSGNFTIDEFAPNSTMQDHHLGMIDIANNIPDQALFTLGLTTYVGDVTHTTQKSFLALAPNLQFAEIEVDDSQGDGFIDPGEPFTLRIHGKNAGHALASNAYLTVHCDNSNLSIVESSSTIGDIEIDESFSAEFAFNTDADLLSGTFFHIELTLHTGAYATTMDYPLTVGVATETFESGDFSFLDWFHSGESPWFITDAEAHSGSFCARSGAIDDNESSHLVVYADILNDGEISFWLKTSTELRRDYLAFYIDNQRKGWWSGETDWTFASYELEAGSHQFIWIYDKSRQGQDGEDCAWIDDITFPRNCVISQVEESTEKKTNILYPNPTSGIFTIELTEESNIGIFNVLGQNVMSFDKVSGIQQVHLDNVPKGLYFVRIQSGNTMETKKLVVE
ncbi:MAG: T9SS type A sorting domain-containing protein [Bacteroidales bacterium]|nr:T9SS type A sorting domain-containing protein [Bacteroidales bacterium]